MSGIRVEGNTSGNVAEVTSNNQLQVNLPTTLSQAGFAAVVNQIDAGTITGTPLTRSALVTRDLRESAGIDTGIFDYFFSAAAQDTGIWKYTITTMTASQSGGFLLLNANSTATTTTGVAMTTWRSFGFESRGGLRVQIVGMPTLTFLANQVVELGLFVPTVTTAPADGVYFRITSAGIIGVVNYNGTETTSGVLLTPIPTAVATVFEIVVSVTGVEFWINGVLGGIILCPAGDGQPFLNLALPLTLNQRNSGAVSGTQMQFKVSSVHVTFMDMQLAMPYLHQLCAQGLMCSQGTAGGTMGSTELNTNGLAPTTGTTLTNNTAALGSGLGGQFSGVPAAGNVDGIICSYQVPVGSVTAKPRILMITGVKVMSAVVVTMTGGPTTFSYSLAYGCTNVNGNGTAEGTSFTTNPTTKAARRVALGMESFAITAALGTQGSAQGIYMPFVSPIAVNPGEFVQVTAKQLTTTSPFTAGDICWLITFDGFWL